MSIKKYLTIKYILGLIVVLGIAGYGSYFLLKKDEVRTAVVTKGTVEEKVLATGKTTPVRSADLAFENTGKVSKVYVETGERVSEGQTLVVQDYSELSADLFKLEASHSEELVRLDQIKSNSQTSLEDAKNNLLNNIRDAYSKADDAVRGDADKLFRNPGSSNARVELKFSEGTATYYFEISNEIESDINSKRRIIEKTLDAWENEINSITVNDDLLNLASNSLSNLSEMDSFLRMLAEGVNSIETTIFSHISTVNGYKTSVSNARSTVQTAISNLQTAIEKLNDAPTMSSAGQNFNDVLIQQAKISQIEADIKNLEARIAKRILRSPINGTITVQDAKRGQIATGGEKIISVISEGELDIEANISEVNIGKVSVGNMAVIKFDAYPGEVFSGQVIYIEPAETLVDGVVNYKVDIEIDTSKQIKSGLTADIEIITASKENVLRLPTYAIQGKNGNYFVETLIGNKSQSNPVSIGINGSDGYSEIVSGIVENDIVTY